MAQSSWPMLLVHLAAVLATAWLLARGERWLWRVADRIIAAAVPVRRRFRSRALALVVRAPASVAGRRVVAPLPARGPPVRV